MTFNYLNKLNECPICQSTHISFFVNENWADRSALFKLLELRYSNSQWYLCLNCTHLFLNPIFSEEIEKRLYSGEGIYRKWSMLNFQNENDYAKTIDNTILTEKSHYNHNKLIKKISKITKGKIKKVLDFGCGFGAAQNAFIKNNFDYLGFETDEWSNKFAKKIGRYGICSDLNIIQDKKIDLIYTYQVFEHISKPNNIFQFLKKFFREDTFFFINVPTIDFNLFKLKNITRKGIEGMNWAHYHSYSVKSLKYLLIRNGFEINNFWLDNGHLNILGKFIQKKQTNLNTRSYLFLKIEYYIQKLKFLFLKNFLAPFIGIPLELTKRLIIRIKNIIIR